MASEGEEVVVGRDVGAAEKLREKVGDMGLPGGVREMLPPRGGPLGRLSFERRSIHLAGGRQGEGRDTDQDSRHEGFGQAFAQPFEEVRFMGRVRVALRHPKRRQPSFSIVVLGRDHHGVMDRVVSAERGLDFARLHTKTTDLELLVGATHELHAAVRAQSSTVAGAVEATARP